MPNKQRRGNKRVGRGTGGRVETCHFHAMIQLIGVAGVYPTFNVTPMNFGRPAVIVDNFDEYRLKRLKFRIYPNGTPLVATVSTATFFPTVVTTAPNFLNSYDNPTVVTLLPTDVAPTPWRVVSKADLQGLQPWYKSENASTATPDTLPGQFYITCNNAASTQVINCEFDGVFQFRGETNAASTPAPLSTLLKRQQDLQLAIELVTERERKKTLADRNKLMLLLGYQESATVTSEGPIPTKWPLQTSSLLAAPSGSRKQ